MQQQDKRTVAFACPHCHQTVVVERSVFQLAAGDSHLECPCGHCAVDIRMEGIRCVVSVPCVYCGREHTVACDTQTLLSEPCLAFSCAASGLGCCYIGQEQPVLAAMARLEQAMDNLPGEQEEKGSFLNEIIMHEVLSEVRDIAQRGGVDCACGSREWKLQVNFSSVDLHCARCGGVLRIPAATDSDLEDLCCRHTLTIRQKER